MKILKQSDGWWYIHHAGRVIDMGFKTEDEAWKWADGNVDDQMFDGPNTLCPPLRYKQ